MMSEIHRVLWATDGSSESREGEAYACLLAQLWGAELIALSVLEFPPGMNRKYPVNEIYLAELLKHATSHLTDAKGRIVAKGIPVRTQVATGIPSEEILAVAQAERADLLVLGTRGKTGLAHVMLGSTAERVIRTAPCPVLAVHTTAGSAESRETEGIASKGFSRILVPVDFSDCSLDAVEYASLVARQAKASITLFHVLEPISYGLDFTIGHVTERQQVREVMSRRLDDLAGALRRAHLTIDCHVSGGLPVDSILERVKTSGADLLVMGTHGRRGLSHVLMGSVAEAVLRKTPCPVLTVRSPKFSPDHQRVVGGNTSSAWTK